VADKEGAGPPAAPLGLTGLVRQGWPLYRGSFSTLAALFVAAYAAFLLLSLAGSSSGRTDAGALTVFVGRVLPLSVLAITGSVATAAAIVAMSSAERIGIGAALGALRPRWREVLGSALLAAMLTLLTALPPLSLLPAILGISFFAVLHGPPMVVHAIVLEGRSLQQAGPRARFLLRRHWARLIMYLLTLALGIALVEGSLTRVAVVLLSEVMSTDALSPTVIVINLLVRGMLIPFLIAVVLAAYFDLRALKDSTGEAPAA
jgi:hypothetical protein